LLRICVPSFFCPETFFFVVVGFSMVARTLCDLWMINTSTAIERTIITRDKKGFRQFIFRFLIGMLPISFVNSLLRYGLNELALRFRVRLTDHLYSKYLRGYTYYRISNLDNRIANVDQVLAQDVEKWAHGLTDLLSNLSKPVLDMIIYARMLSVTIGLQGPMNMLIYLAISGFVLTNLRRPLARYTVEEQRLEGSFRAVNAKLIANSEEIAFYGGHFRELRTVRASFDRLVHQLRKTMQFRLQMGIIDSITTKYLSTVVGFLVLRHAFLQKGEKQQTVQEESQVMEDYYKNGRMLINLAGAMGRVVLAGRELTRLAGFTARVSELEKVLDDLNLGEYTRSMLAEPATRPETPSANAIEGATTSTFTADTAASLKLTPNSGKSIEADHVIRFDSVPVVTPNGDVLIKSLSFEVKSGCNVLVSGPNGCGKSSLFRILSGLWPLFGGSVTKPPKDKLFYIPQRPYLTTGTLRDQVTYPLAENQVRRRGVTDAQLLEVLKEVHLGHLVEREGGWDSVQDWMDVLSGGEKQRIAMARLFFARPQFAILDECTSAVSIDVEGYMYSRCRELDITLFTVSHRKSLWKYHDFVLHLDGRGNYDFKPIVAGQTEEFGS